MDLFGPGAEEGQRRPRRARGSRVGLHVEVDRASWPHADALRVGDRVAGGGGALRAR